MIFGLSTNRVEDVRLMNLFLGSVVSYSLSRRWRFDGINRLELGERCLVGIRMS